MLNAEEREKLRSLEIFKIYYAENKKGKPVDSSGKEVKVPSFLTLKNDMFVVIKCLGYTIERTRNPEEAHIIIRVYHKLHVKKLDNMYNLFGANCFTKEDGKWLALNSTGRTFVLDEECIVTFGICQDDYVEFECEYFDFFFKVVEA